MPVEGALERLVGELLERTRRGQLVWVRGSGPEEQLVSYSGRSGGASIWPRDWDDALPFVFALYDSGGTEVEQVHTTTEPDSTGDGVLTPMSVKIISLYRAARESAVAGLVSNLLDELAALDPPSYDDEEPF